MSKLLIGITSYNRLPYTKLCLRSLEHCETSHDITVVIVDNGSKSEVLDYLKDWDGKVIGTKKFFVLPLGKNYGVGKALNRVIDKYRTDDMHFMKLDNDTCFPSIEISSCISSEQVNNRCLEEIIDCLENSTEHISAIGALLFDRNRATKAPAKVVTTTTGNTYVTEDFTSSHINGALQLYHRDTMNILRRFSENKVYGFEDSIMATSANQYGLGLAAEWLWIAHIDRLDLGEDSQEILRIKRESLLGNLEVPD